MTTTTTTDLKSLNIAGLARVVSSNWQNVNYAAAPYLSAMHQLNVMSDHYYADDARSIVIYFLSNASSWRGPVAKAVKAELKRRLNAR